MAHLTHFFTTVLGFVLHLDTHLTELVQTYGAWTYAILFLIIFCETGLVVTPFLPGDSLLFAVGALAANGSMHVGGLWVLLVAAAILGNTANYLLGATIGGRAVRRGSRWLKPRYLERTHEFYDKYGGKTLIITRFVPIIRTFAPFVAGLGKMPFGRFTTYNAAGGLLWVTPLLLGGFFFGNLPVVRDNFGIVAIAIIVISLLPAVVEVVRGRRARPTTPT
ncbi:MAG: putative rane protein [Gemmatimonadetes bacterium]|nr:putative rane protein [Gemmatimonadota bacterium]